MEANQLIKALGDAAAAVKPPQEYCFLWIDWWATCMTKAEWSGWMQAIGAVVALFLVWLQTTRQIAADRLARKEEHASRVRGTMVRAEHVVKELRHLCEKSQLVASSIALGILKPEAVQETRDLFDGLGMQLMLLPFWDIPEPSLAIELHKVQHAAKLFVITLDREQASSAHMLTNLIAACEEAQGSLARQLQALP